MTRIRFVSFAMIGVALIADLATAQTAQSAKPAVVGGVSKAVFLKNVDDEFTKTDSNGDKIVTSAELEAFRAALIAARRRKANEALFTRLDTNKDGVVSKGEFAAMIGPMPKVNVSGLVARIDTNKDAKITPAEFRANALLDFDRMDTNKDGNLDASEASRNNKK